MEKTENSISKPLILELEEAEKETVDAVNDIMARHKLTHYFFEQIIDKIHKQLIEGKKGEISSASAWYKAQKTETETETEKEE